MGTLSKTSQTIFTYYFISEHSKHFSLFEKKIAFYSGTVHLAVVGTKMSPPPPDFYYGRVITGIDIFIFFFFLIYILFLKKITGRILTIRMGIGC